MEQCSDDESTFSEMTKERPDVDPLLGPRYPLAVTRRLTPSRTERPMDSCHRLKKNETREKNGK